MPSKLEQLKTMTVVVSDSGDFGNLSAFGVTDSTTNPSLILKAAKLGTYDHLLEEAVVWGRSHGAMTSQITDRVAVNFGAELTKVVPGRVSTPTSPSTRRRPSPRPAPSSRTMPRAAFPRTASSSRSPRPGKASAPSRYFRRRGSTAT